ILKAGSRWRDNGDGTYTAAYTATTAGSHLKATVRLGGRGNPASSDAYAIMAATPDGAKSAISTDATAYVSGSDMAVTVTLKDGTGQRSDRDGRLADGGYGHRTECDP
ncbi:intimin, partial [Salmonella enterica subsp. enterica serovar Tennessee str. TXSC_TXSC08-21]